MLTKQRHEIILKLLEEKKSITVTEVKELLHTSESTVRRDITALHNSGKLEKVFGGAIAIENSYSHYEPSVAQKEEINVEEKRQIAKYASSLIKPNDFVFIDAGTTTGYMLDYIEEMSATYVTNAVAHGRKLAANGYKVLLIGGELKGRTEAVVGNMAMQTLGTYHFTKGFFGSNGISHKEGFSTPDANEALIKKTAMGQCRQCYVLADHTKFEKISSVTFAPFKNAHIVTDCKIRKYEGCKNVIIAQSK